ncbi:hypothetical protein [Shewanella sp. NIFS-20-20]|uniref:hypothetical protein n=1 Tax=Shewanella sp. NIFS-20-20 TaxID=2853806 RepID=UPI001C48F6C8|nr:hypothetical protein [Shewanella sp. NIFS-20-20]MBV7316365.1 hypothetical protein [Shewanella sp. NIFS-20-20]
MEIIITYLNNRFGDDQLFHWDLAVGLVLLSIFAGLLYVAASLALTVMAGLMS